MSGDDAVLIGPGQQVLLSAFGRNEFWLQDWLAADLSRLGLGPLALVHQEQTQSGGGNLDLLAAADHTYYSIEVQLGEVDSDHGFRVFDYWARNRRRYPDKTHVAVLVAETTTGRYRPALEELSQYVPLLVVEMRCWRGTNEALLVPDLVIANPELDVSGTPLAVTAGSTRTQEDWREIMTDDAWSFKEKFVEWVRLKIGDVKIDYTPKSYVGLRVGRRVWAPLWPRKDGAYIYLPDPDGSRKEESDAFEHFRELLDGEGLTIAWNPTYNAGANPISIRMRTDDLAKPAVLQFLKGTYEAVVTSSPEPWSVTHGLADPVPESPVFGDHNVSEQSV